MKEDFAAYRSRTVGLVSAETGTIVNSKNLPPELFDAYKDHITWMKEKAKKKTSFLTVMTNIVQITYDLYQVVLAITACVLYVMQTYMEEGNEDEFLLCDIIIATLFLLDWCHSLLLSNNRLQFI
jgi:hypothetical protein